MSNVCATLQRIINDTNAKGTGNSRRGACPACQDRDTKHPALSIQEKADGTIRLTCFKNACDFRDICRLLGISTWDLLPYDHPKRNRDVERGPFTAGRLHTDGCYHVCQINGEDLAAKKYAAEQIAKHEKPRMLSPEVTAIMAQHDDTDDEYRQDRLWRFAETLWLKDANHNPKDAGTLLHELGARWTPYNHAGMATDKSFLWIPERNGDNDIIGISVRAEDGGKCFVEGGSRGLVHLPSLIDNGKKRIFFPEGLTDTITFLMCGENAVGRPNNNSRAAFIADYVKANKIPDDWQLIVVGDNDCKDESYMRVDLDKHADSPDDNSLIPNGITTNWPGRRGALDTASTVSELLGGRVVHVAMPSKWYKDVRSWWNFVGTRPHTESLADSLILYGHFPKIATYEDAAREVEKRADKFAELVGIEHSAATLNIIDPIVVSGESAAQIVPIADAIVSKGIAWANENQLSGGAKDVYDELKFQHDYWTAENKAIEECMKEYESERETLHKHGPKIFYDHPEELCPRCRSYLFMHKHRLNIDLFKVRCKMNQCEQCFKWKKRKRCESLMKHIDPLMTAGGAMHIGGTVDDWNEQRRKMLTTQIQRNNGLYNFFHLGNGAHAIIATEPFQGSQALTTREEVEKYLVDTLATCPTPAKYKSFYGGSDEWKMSHDRDHDESEYHFIGKVRLPIIAVRKIVAAKLGTNKAVKIIRPRDKDVVMKMHIDYRPNFRYKTNEDGTCGIDVESVRQDPLVRLLLGKAEESPVYVVANTTFRDGLPDGEYLSMWPKYDEDQLFADSVGNLVA